MLRDQLAKIRFFLASIERHTANGYKHANTGEELPADGIDFRDGMHGVIADRGELVIERTSVRDFTPHVLEHGRSSVRAEHIRGLQRGCIFDLGAHKISIRRHCDIHTWHE